MTLHTSVVFQNVAFTPLGSLVPSVDVGAVTLASVDVGPSVDAVVFANVSLALVVFCNSVVIVATVVVAWVDGVVSTSSSVI